MFPPLARSATVAGFLQSLPGLGFTSATISLTPWATGSITSNERCLSGVTHGAGGDRQFLVPPLLSGIEEKGNHVAFIAICHDRNKVLPGCHGGV